MKRTLKLHTRFYSSQSSIQWNRMQPSKKVPELVLKGNWLNDLGFLPGTYVDVTAVDKHKIIIELLR